MKRALMLLSLVPGLLACGGADASRAEEPRPASAEGSTAERCLAEASAPRERKAGAPLRVGVKHILVKHAEAARAGTDITRNRGEACVRALEALDKLQAGADFDEVVAEYSDEAGAATRGGSLGTVSRDDMDPAFADAAFLLDLDGVSYVVESKSGFHIILRSD